MSLVVPGGTITAGTGITATTGNISTTVGNVISAGTVTSGTTMTAGTGLTVTSGNITATASTVNCSALAATGATGITSSTSTDYAIASAQGVTQAINSLTWTKVTYYGNAVVSGCCSYSAGDVTVTKAGMYLITAFIEYAANATGDRTIQITVNGGGGQPSGNFGSTSVLGNATPRFGCSTMILCGVNDIIRVYTYQTSGSLINITSNFWEYLVVKRLV
jgi:hypothetical protein